jgi:hypothetical protein
MSTKYPTKLTWEEENPTLYQSLLWEDICGDAFRRLEKTMREIKDKNSVSHNNVNQEVR